MSNITMRLDLSTAQTKDLIGLLVESLANKTNTASARIGLGINIYDDQTRTGLRNGHGIRIHADGVSAGVFATAYDVIVDGE